MNIYVIHLNKTSHKSPNIKWQKIAFYLIMTKMCYFLFNSFKIFVFYIIMLDFLSIFGYFESLFN